jgi:hypothetical protein
MSILNFDTYGVTGCHTPCYRDMYDFPLTSQDVLEVINVI